MTPARREPDARRSESAERWVNARVTIVVPLEVPVDADPVAKQEAVSEVMEEVSGHLPELYRHAVMTGEWEDAKAVDAGQVSPLPDPPAKPNRKLKMHLLGGDD